MTKELENFYDICPPDWKTSPGGEEFCLEFSNIISPIIKGSNCLIIGTGFEPEQYFTWPDLLIRCGASNIEYLEISEIYLNRWKNNKYKVHRGDVCSIADWLPKEYDIIFWLHGPEHIPAQIMNQTFAQLLEFAPNIISSCPFGSYYDYQHDLHGNLYEEHIQKNLDIQQINFLSSLGYNLREFGVRHAPDAQILIWRTNE